MTEPSRRTSSTQPYPLRLTRRRQWTFSLVLLLVVCGCVVALLAQAPNFDTLDIWALPLMSVTLLTAQALLVSRAIHFEAAISVAFVTACAYLLLALSHQFQVMPPGARTLSENTYWFALLYTSVFFIYPPRLAARVSLSILGVATLICAWHLVFTAPADTRLSLIGASVQLIVSSGALILIQATFGFQRAQLLASRSAALSDMLTGIANRRAAEERLRELSQKKAVYTVALFDLDHFKQVNDAHGHATGDLVLRGVAQLAQALLPTGGLVARWGGEEFLMILPALSDTQVRKVLNTLRNELRQQRYGEVVGVTASFGVASAVPGELPETVVVRADEAMYSAKQQGRNDIRLSEWRRGPASPRS